VSILCEHCGGELEYFKPDDEWYCPDCTRAALLREVEAADAEAAVLNLLPPSGDFPPPAGGGPPF
jgi:hypothetical protein